MNSKLFIIILTLFVSTKCKSQIDTIYFSTTGDTVLYSFWSIGNVSHDTVKHSISIATFNPKDTIKRLSSFDITTLKAQNVFKHIPNDTLEKYHLTYDGIRYDSLDKNITLKIVPKKIKIFGQAEKSGENIYTADILIVLKCKSKVIRKETIKYMFQGVDKKSLKKDEICTVTYWKKANTERYLFYYRIRRNVTITKEGNGSSHSLISYLDYY